MCPDTGQWYVYKSQPDPQHWDSLMIVQAEMQDQIQAQEKRIENIQVLFYTNIL